MDVLSVPNGAAEAAVADRDAGFCAVVRDEVEGTSVGPSKSVRQNNEGAMHLQKVVVKKSSPSSKFFLLFEAGRGLLPLLPGVLSGDPSLP